MSRAPFYWPSASPAREISAMTNSAPMRPMESQLQQENSSFSVGMKHQWQPKKAVFSMGCPTHETRGGSAYMEQMSLQLQQKKASFSAGIEPQWQPKKAAFSVDQQHQTWGKELEKEASRRDKGTSSGLDEECKEFVRMFREKLQEFAMILSKKYHYNFPVEYFDDYHGSFNKEEFLGMEQQEEKLKEKANKEALSIDHFMEEVEEQQQWKVEGLDNVEGFLSNEKKEIAPAEGRLADPKQCHHIAANFGYNSGTNGVGGSILGILPISAAISNWDAVPGMGASPTLGKAEPRITSSMGNIVGGGNVGKNLNYGEVDRATKAKGQSEIVEKEVFVEGYSSKYKEKGVAEFITWNQSGATDIGARVFTHISDLPKSEGQSNLEQNMDLTWVKIGNEKMETTLAGGKLKDRAEGVERFAEENKTITAVLVFAPTGKTKLLSAAGWDEPMADCTLKVETNLDWSAIVEDWEHNTDVAGFCFLDLASNYVLADFIYLVDRCPHDWLFFQYAAVAHHGERKKNQIEKVGIG